MIYAGREGDKKTECNRQITLENAFRYVSRTKVLSDASINSKFVVINNEPRTELKPVCRIDPRFSKIVVKRLFQTGSTV